MMLTKRQALGSVSKGLSFVCYQLCYLLYVSGFRLRLRGPSDVVSNKTGNGIMI